MLHRGGKTHICLEDSLKKAPAPLGSHRNEEILNLATTCNTRTFLEEKQKEQHQTYLVKWSKNKILHENTRSY